MMDITDQGAPRPVDGEDGAVATEYALLAALIAIAIIGGVSLFGREVDALFSSVPDYIWGKKG